MSKFTLNLHLTATVLILALLPLAASFYLLNDVLKSAVSLGISDENSKILSDYRNDLRKLASLDPANENAYREQFKRLSDELFVYQNPQTLTSLLKRTFVTYYLLLFVAILAIALVVAILLGKKISTSYKKLYLDDLRKSARLKDLEHFDEWQVLAAKLAHEIKNPLTPIEVIVSNMTKVYDTSARQDFRAALEATRDTVMIEIDKIKRLVNHFARFSRLPEPETTEKCIVDCCTSFISRYCDAWENIDLQLKSDIKPGNAFIEVDSILLDQCFLNIVTNAVEANTGKTDLYINFSLAAVSAESIELMIFNNGATIPESERCTIFRMYVTSKPGKENFGLGLPICRKIILDMGGDIECVSLMEGAAFRIILPLCRPLK